MMEIPDVDGEEWFIMRDEFLRYVDCEVNPQRLAHALSPIREHEARECYRILYEFWRKWEKK